MSAADTGFLIICAAMVMLMTPGLALFYGGMIRVKSTLNMLLMVFVAMGVSSVLWVLYGFTLAFGDSVSGEGGGLVGNLGHLGLGDLLPREDAGDLLVLVLFQLMFAVLTPALIAGALAERVRFGPWALFIALWVTLVYFPVAHWVWGDHGWIAGLELDGREVIDFAGGTAVHINAGAAALAVVLVVGRRVGFRQDTAMRPHNLPMVLLGASLLWFGWFGFNAGSAGAADATAALMALNTMVATGAAVLGWLVYERLRHGVYTTLGAASGAVGGLVAITPAGANVHPLGAVAIGLVAGAVCAGAVGLKFRLGYDDSLDVVGVHLVGGLVGTLLVGWLALDGAGGLAQFTLQAGAAAAVLAYSFVVTWLLASLLHRTVGLRADPGTETGGLDRAYHAETGYDLTQIGGSLGEAVVPAEPSAASPGSRAGAPTDP